MKNKFDEGSFEGRLERAKHFLIKTPIIRDWSNFLKSDRNSNTYYFTDTGFSPAERAKYLPWTKEEVRAVEPQLTILTTLPIECKGTECPFADSCPLVQNKVVERVIGKVCPVECVDAFRYFAWYIVDLGIQATDFTDIQMVNDLVRLQILINRCDKFLQKEDPFEIAVSGVDSKTTLTHKARGPHALVQQQKLLRQDMDKLYQRLQASREAKLSANNTNQGLFQNISNVLAAIRKSKEEENNDNTILPMFEDDLVSEEII